MSQSGHNPYVRRAPDEGPSTVPTPSGATGPNNPARTGRPADAAPASQGPITPQHGVPVPRERLARVAIPPNAVHTVWWVGAHGGAGESTMSRLLPGSYSSEHRWPVPPPPTPTPVVLVARTNFSGLQAAQRAATEWASGSIQGVSVLGLVLIADAPGRLPRVLDDFADIVGGGVPHVWNIPWVEDWRRGEEPQPENTPDEVFSVLEAIYALGTG